jgi:hypothetical protein
VRGRWGRGPTSIRRDWDRYGGSNRNGDTDSERNRGDRYWDDRGRHCDRYAHNGWPDANCDRVSDGNRNRGAETGSLARHPG